MSAPDTNVDKQTKRHKGALAGIAAAVIFAFVIAVVWVGGIMGDDKTGDAADVNPVAAGEG